MSCEIKGYGAACSRGASSPATILVPEASAQGICGEGPQGDSQGTKLFISSFKQDYVHGIQFKDYSFEEVYITKLPFLSIHLCYPLLRPLNVG